MTERQRLDLLTESPPHGELELAMALARALALLIEGGARRAALALLIDPDLPLALTESDAEALLEAAERRWRF